MYSLLLPTTRRRIGIILAALVLWCAGTASTSAAPFLWYNGDFDEINGLSNEVNTNVSQAAVYDDFTVPVGQIWTITEVFSNNLMADLFITAAHWEIRSNVSTADGGTLIDSGDAAATQTATGRSGFGVDEYTVSVSGLNVVLGAGTYWLTVNPIGSGAGNSAVTTTSGLNSVGVGPGNEGNSYFDSVDFGSAFEPAANLVGPPGDFSMGVMGTVALVPEPSALVSVALGAGCLFLGRAFRRGRR